MRLVFVTHPEVEIDPHVPVPDWHLSETGRRRAETFAAHPVLEGVTALWSSEETKARETAAAIAERHRIPVRTDAALGENDRSSTGFLPGHAFEAAADRFFAEPGTSFRGWETARAAQARIARAVTSIASTQSGGLLVIVSHGAVGTLLRCHFAGLAIDRRFDQPRTGCYWTAEGPSFRDPSEWQSIA